MMPMSFEDPEAMMERQRRDFQKRLAFYEDAKEMFAEVSTHHLYVIGQLIRTASHMPKGDAIRYVAFLEGKFAAHLEMRGVCGSCGKNHLAEELAEMDPESKFSTFEAPDIEQFEFKQTLPKPASDEQLADHNVRWDPTPDQTERVVCTGECNGYMSWPSLEDRIADSATCGACANMSKWGTPDGR